ncbi:hypothetical protein DdX_09572 [Ditylenchus destructor]|uniref:F-box domain-containing protein n=1 Tax=Ditylenchus destructor TaxID=166010 RepID=A0AAD4MZG5_9BILA|nr:hypothetical protein DdX_09572 [Ditylenchus destructor]
MDKTSKISRVSAVVQSLTSEIFVDTLRYLSRKELVRKIYLVNRRFMSLADAYVPNLYISKNVILISYSPESHAVTIFPGGKRETLPEIFPETLGFKITSDSGIPVHKDCNFEEGQLPEEGHLGSNPFPWYFREEVIEASVMDGLGVIGKGYGDFLGLKYPDEEYALSAPFPWYFRFCEVRAVDMCDAGSKFWSFIESQLKSTFAGCHLKQSFFSHDYADPKQYYIDYLSSRIFPLFPNCSRYTLCNLQLTKGNCEEENCSSILSLPSLFNCDNVAWCAVNDTTTVNSLCDALEIISWLHHSNETIQRQRNLLIIEWNTNRNTIHEIVKAAKELFLTDNKGSVNFSIAYHYNCKKRDKKDGFDVSDENNPHADIENWSEVFCIINQSTRQQLLFKKSASKNRECYILRRHALD